MFKKGDYVKIVQCEGDSSCDLVGKTARITKVNKDRGYNDYELSINTGSHYWVDAELKLAREKASGMAKKAYQVLQDTPAWNKGAILVLNEDDCYEPIEDLWNAVEDNEDYAETAKVVENAPKFFGRVYEMSKGKKAIYVTKEKAQEMASKFYETE